MVMSMSIMVQRFTMHDLDQGGPRVFSLMIEMGMELNRLIFMGLLHVCNYTSLVDKGSQVFNGADMKINSWNVVIIISAKNEHDKAHVKVVKFSFHWRLAEFKYGGVKITTLKSCCKLSIPTNTSQLDVSPISTLSRNDIMKSVMLSQNWKFKDHVQALLQQNCYWQSSTEFLAIYYLAQSSTMRKGAMLAIDALVCVIVYLEFKSGRTSEVYVNNTVKSSIVNVATKLNLIEQCCVIDRKRYDTLIAAEQIAIILLGKSTLLTPTSGNTNISIAFIGA
ncbi:hypothetical protein DITRI_Ditri15bG0047600 [Diplodiscus trichospermus]